MDHVDGYEHVVKILEQVTKAIGRDEELALHVLPKLAFSRFGQCSLDGGNEPRKPVLEDIVRCSVEQAVDRCLFSQGSRNENERDFRAPLASKSQCGHSVE